jgi:hypothetical protein
MSTQELVERLAIPFPRGFEEIRLTPVPGVRLGPVPIG